MTSNQISSVGIVPSITTQRRPSNLLMESEVILSVAGKDMMESSDSECRLDLLAYHRGVGVDIHDRRQQLRGSSLHPAIGDTMEVKRMKAKKLLNRLKSGYYDHSRLKQSLPFVVLLVYTVIGAAIFYALEHRTDQQVSQTNEKRHEWARAQMCERIWELKMENFTKAKILAESRVALDWFEMESNFKGPTTKVTLKWDFYGALIYVMTIYTTIVMSRSFCLHAEMGFF